MWLKRQYRRRPMVAIATTAASVDITLGVLEGRFSLALLGIALGLGGGLWSWRQVNTAIPQAPAIFLPYASSGLPVIQTEFSPLLAESSDRPVPATGAAPVDHNPGRSDSSRPPAQPVWPESNRD